VSNRRAIRPAAQGASAVRSLLMSGAPRVALATVHANARFIPLSLWYLKSFLVEARGHAFDDVAIVESTRDDSVDDITARILKHRPSIVGFSVYVWNIATLRAVAERVKAASPSTRIIAGGPEVGPVASDALARCPAIDAIVRSEGEHPFAEIVEAWSAGRDLTGVSGVTHRLNGRIVANDDAPILKSLDVLPSPHTPRFAATLGDASKRIICIETQRGCVFRCNFCFYNKDLSIRNRRFDLDRVKAEILFWLQQDVSQIFLMDPVFNLNAARAKDICRFVAANNHRQIPFHAEIWAEFVDEELARLFRDAHFEFLEVGLQTTDDTALAAVDRRLKIAPFVDGIRWLREYGLKFELQLIYGLPGETRETFRRSLDFAKSLRPYFLEVFRLMILPGTELWRKTASFNLAFDQAPPYYVRSHDSMSEDDIAYGTALVDAVDAIGSSTTIELMSKEQGVTFSDLADDWIEWRREQPHGNLQAFVDAACRRRGLPVAFYGACAATETRRVRGTVEDTTWFDG
jgi:anaerobic magnesium-protoporphyrin IX monomethyl ester cyclase